VDRGGPPIVALLERTLGVTKVVSSDMREGAYGYEVESQRGRDVRRELARAIVNAGVGLLELRPMRMSLEDIFLSLTTEEGAEQQIEAPAEQPVTVAPME
jgi:ABC-2 type transport system ATP-binding protein